MIVYVVVTLDPGRVTLDQVEAKLGQLGYRVAPQEIRR